MSDDLTLYAGALWLGLLTALSPCPLATNLAATAYLARRVESRKRAIAGTLAYTLRKVLKPRLIATFFGIVATEIMFVGYLFNFLM